MSGFVIPDETRRNQSTAADPAVSAWVAAHAGSGKTHVLAQRVIRLLLEGTDPARILCLTYTRAAAANMATRVFDTLGAWTRLDDVELARNIAELQGRQPSAALLARARRLFAEALETPGGLKIQTIHAFCEAVLHQFPLEANIAGHFEMLDARMEAALVAEARREMIAGTTDPDQPGLAEAFAIVLDHGGEFGLEGLLSEIVSRRDALRRFLDRAGTGAELRSWLHESLTVPEDTSPASILAAFWPDPYFSRARCEELAERANVAGKVRASEFAASMLAVFALDDPRSILLALRDVFLRRNNSQWQPKSARNIAPKDVAAHFPELTDEFDRMAEMALEATDRLALLGMLEATHAALTVADRLIAIYERLKSARGYLDFNDLIVRTVNLLARQDASAWVQYKLDKGIDHILIDEAQDTSPDQWAVVNALAADFFAGRSAREEAGRTVFAVGDEKQSIYSFQGADPESFWMLGREYQKTVANAGSAFEHVRLRHSFRSVEDVLAAVDLTFSREEVRQGLTRDPEPLEHRAIRQAAPGYVELWPSVTPQIVEEPDEWTQPIDHATAPAVRRAAPCLIYTSDAGDRRDS
jgi:ATP-dependent helicase/nuclease subunit A